jgi:hypothetical protein
MYHEAYHLIRINSKVTALPLRRVPTADSRLRARRLERKTQIMDRGGSKTEEDEKPVGAWDRVMMVFYGWSGGSAQFRHSAVDKGM